jgi:5-methylcytosine-specific restriction endonuclease McrA
VTDRVEVIDAYEDRLIHSATQVFQMPSIVRFLHKVTGMFRRGIKFNRRNVWLRDKGACGYCGKKVQMTEFTFDHVFPRNQGGKTRWENIVVCCPPCNQRKSDKTLEQARMRLRIQPVRPKSLPGAYTPLLVWNENMPQSWKDYLGSVHYWHGEIDEEKG